MEITNYKLYVDKAISKLQTEIECMECCKSGPPGRNGRNGENFGK